ncbi:MAG: phage tail sheath family protein [Saprospirales bacterium]|nr:phage tail sheath family protein [Saprospirales bacterium]
MEKRFPRIYSQVVATLQQVPNVLPASPFVVGAYVASDKAKGVWKAPANVELKAVRKPVIEIPESQQDMLVIDNVGGKSINAIRSFSGRGTVIWGARTLAGNDNEWRYVPLRRFANMLEESIRKGTKYAVFEPNDEPLWAKVRGEVENFLFGFWQKGAILGSKPDQAFFVRMGLGQTMTSQDILNGKYILELGFAPLKPAEFVVLRIGL